MEGTLKVSPQALRQKSGEFESDRSEIRTLIGQMTQSVTGLNSAWEGEAFTTYQSAYQALEDDIQRLDRMIAEHVKDLNDMADVYAKAESAATATNQALPKDAIE